MSIRITADRSLGTREKSQRKLDRDVYEVTLAMVSIIMESLGSVTDVIEIVKLYPADQRSERCVAFRIMMKEGLSNEKFETSEFYLDLSHFPPNQIPEKNTEQNLSKLFKLALAGAFDMQLDKLKQRHSALSAYSALLGDIPTH